MIPLRMSNTKADPICIVHTTAQAFQASHNQTMYIHVYTSVLLSHEIQPGSYHFQMDKRNPHPKKGLLFIYFRKDHNIAMEINIVGFEIED